MAVLSAFAVVGLITAVPSALLGGLLVAFFPNIPTWLVLAISIGCNGALTAAGLIILYRVTSNTKPA